MLCFVLEYDGSPRRFGTCSNEDGDNQPQSVNRSIYPKLSTNNYSSPSPPRPGFPQRVLSSYSHRTLSPNESQKHFMYDDQMGIPAFTATSKLIPTTFINSSVFEPSHEKTQTIHEEPEDSIILQEKIVLKSPVLDDRHKKQQQKLFEPTLGENANIFQVTSPTEENVPTTTFDYLYEFSETRKVLEEFFKCPDSDQIKELEKFSDFNESDDSLVSCCVHFM